MKVLVLSSTRKERDGIAEYTRQLFRPAFLATQNIEAAVADITPGTILRAPFQKTDIIHVQHEFFMFDRLVGVTALLYYPWLWLWSWPCGYRIVTTIHSTYNVDELEAALPHFAKYKWLFPLGKLYLRFHLWLVGKLSGRFIILSKIGVENIRRVFSARDLERKVCYTHLGNYVSNIRMRSHGMLTKQFNIRSSQKIFTLFGFAFPTKGYEYAIQAMDILVNRESQKDFKLVIVSGETGKGSFPGGGQGGTYVRWLKQLAADYNLESNVIFTGYLANDDPLLEEIFAETFCFLFPYLDRSFPSGAISTVIATKKPLLVSDIRSFQEYEGLATFREKDAASLAAKMLELAESPVLVEKLAGITRANAEKFAMKNILVNHAQIYRDLAQTDQPGRLGQPD